MKKSIIIFCLIFSIVLNLSGCTLVHKHNWEDATCTQPKTCKECGETEGEPLGHDYTNFICTRCGDKNYDMLKNINFYTMQSDQNYNPSHMWITVTSYDFSTGTVTVDLNSNLFYQFERNYLKTYTVIADSSQQISFGIESSEMLTYQSGDCLYFQGVYPWIIESIDQQDEKVVVKTSGKSRTGKYYERWFVPLSSLNLSSAVYNDWKFVIEFN